MGRYLIEVPHTQTGKCFIDGVVLEGNKEELYIKLQDTDYVTSLGIHESFWFSKFRLVPEENVDFPDYKI